MAKLLRILILSTILLTACGASSRAASAAAPTAAAAQSGSGHPRLIVREQDVARLRSWSRRKQELTEEQR